MSRFKAIQSTEANYATIIKDSLYFGDIIFARDIRTMKKMGINCVINLISYQNEKYKLRYSYDMDVLYYPIIDSPKNDISWAENPSKYIEEEMEKGKKIFVHCYLGISRSASLIIYFLMTRKNMTLKSALDYVRQKRSIACPNIGFMKGLCDLDLQLYGTMSITPYDYSIDCLCYSFPELKKEEIENKYKETQQKINNGDYSTFSKAVDLSKIEPIGYFTIDLLISQNNILRLRDKCLKHQPFE